MDFQPIVTAPKDGQKIYAIFNGDASKIMVIYWVPAQGKWWRFGDQGSSVLLEFGHTPAPFYIGELNPSHWAVIPISPKL